MPIYEKSTKELIKDWAELHLEPGKTFTKAEVVNWFQENYPRIKSNTVGLHIEGFCTNNARHRSHHPSIRPNTGWDLFFKLGSGAYRPWDPVTDPEPEYDIEVPPIDGDDDDDPPICLDVNAVREFAYEKDLQNFLAKNISLIEPGLRLFEDEGFLGVEFPAGGRRIDLLAIDNAGMLVVIELKASRAYDRVIGQVARYMAWVKENMDPEVGVRGIIIANSISDDLRLAASLLPTLKLMEYNISFSIAPID